MSKEVLALVCFGAAFVFAVVGLALGSVTPYVGWLCTGVFAIYSGLVLLIGVVFLRSRP